MKQLSTLLLFFALLSTLFAQKVDEKSSDKIKNKISSVDGTNETQAFGDKIEFKDGSTTLLEIRSLSGGGGIYLPPGGTGTPTFMLHSGPSGELFWNGDQLGLASGGVSAIGDLSDVKYIGSSLYIGDGAGAADNSQGFWNNTALGHNALKSITSGDGNIAIGESSLEKMTTGYQNIAIGKNALLNTTYADGNVAIGNSSLMNQNSGDGYNVAIGEGSLLNNINGKNNIAIGYNAGYNETESNKLYIESSSSATPLIYGDFTDGSEMVKINGDLYSEGRAYGANFTASNQFGVGIKAVASDLSTGLFQGNTGGSFEAKAGEGTGVRGVASNSGNFTNYGGSFQANGEAGIGVLGYAGTNNGSNTNYGGKFEAEGVSGFGVHAKAPLTGWAGYFDGNASISNKVFIGTTPQTPISSLHIKQQSGFNAIRMEYNSDTDYWDMKTASDNDLNFYYNGNLRSWISDADGAFSNTSDERLKTNINEIKGILPLVLGLKPSRYIYKDDKSQNEKIGFIAQEVQQFFPEAVSEKEGLLGINYSVFGVLAIEAIKEQQTKIADLEARLARLEAAIR